MVKNLNVSGIYLSNKALQPSSQAYIFYEDGSVFYGGYTDNVLELQQILNKYHGLLAESKRFKKRWGCYKVEGSKITIQTFYELHGGRFGIINEEGVFINDATYVITKAMNEKKSVVLSDTFSLQPFNKPDSTNWLKARKCFN